MTSLDEKEAQLRKIYLNMSWVTIGMIFWTSLLVSLTWISARYGSDPRAGFLAVSAFGAFQVFVIVLSIKGIRYKLERLLVAHWHKESEDLSGGLDILSVAYLVYHVRNNDVSAPRPDIIWARGLKVLAQRVEHANNRCISVQQSDLTRDDEDKERGTAEAEFKGIRSDFWEARDFLASENYANSGATQFMIAQKVRSLVNSWRDALDLVV